MNSKKRGIDDKIIKIGEFYDNEKMYSALFNISPLGTGLSSIRGIKL